MRILLIVALTCSVAGADRYRADFSIDATLEIRVPDVSPAPELDATWDLEVYFDPDRRRYDLFTTLHGSGVHATSVRELAGLGVDDAGQLRGHITDPVSSQSRLDLRVHPNDFRIEMDDDAMSFQLRREHERTRPFSFGRSGRYSTVFHYEPVDMAMATVVPDGDVDGNGVVNFVDFITLSINYGRHDGDVTYKHGDFDYNNRVNFDDFVVLSRNYGAGIASVAVPEPSGWLCLVLGLALWRAGVHGNATRSTTCSTVRRCRHV